MTKEQFKDQIMLIINKNVAEILSKRDPKNQFLTYFDFQVVTTSVSNVFRNRLETVPPKIIGVCLIAEALLAPDRASKQAKLKAAVAATGGAAGMAAIIAAIGTAIGWHAGMIYAVTTFFVGSSFAGPLGWGAAGAALILISGYFFFHNDATTVSQQAVDALKGGLNTAIDLIWDEHGSKLGN